MKRIIIRTIIIIIIISIIIKHIKGEACKTGTEEKKIKLHRANWLGSQVNVEIAKILLEEQLNYCVEVVDRTIPESFEEIGKNEEKEAILEVWVEGRAVLMKEYVEEKKLLVTAGQLGVTGRLGWYIMRDLLETHEELDTYRAYRVAETVELFATNETTPEGQFIGPPESWSSHDETIIKNLVLKLKVKPTDDDQAEQKLMQHAIDYDTKKKPFIMYFWEPHQLFSRYNLARVLLPSYTESCYSDYNQQQQLVDCDYPAELLQKLMNPKAAEDQTLALFLKAFTITTEQQTEMMGKIYFDEQSMENVARQFIEDNKEIWAAWINENQTSINLRAMYITLGILIPLGILVLCMLIILITIMVIIRRHYKQRYAPKSGRFTIVFTDIQNSTMLWDAEPTIMKEVLSIHDRVMRKYIKKYKGYEVKTVGDSFMIAFGHPVQAIKWASETLVLLREANWPTDILRNESCETVVDATGKLVLRGPRVRIGMHYGEPQCKYNRVSGRYDYFGPDVNMASRIEASAYGGTIFISEALKEMVNDWILTQQENLQLRFAGEYQFKGIDEAQSLYQIRRSTDIASTHKKKKNAIFAESKSVRLDDEETPEDMHRSLIHTINEWSYNERQAFICSFFKKLPPEERQSVFNTLTDINRGRLSRSFTHMHSSPQMMLMHNPHIIEEFT